MGSRLAYDPSRFILILNYQVQKCSSTCIEYRIAMRELIQFFTLNSMLS